MGEAEELALPGEGRRKRLLVKEPGEFWHLVRADSSGCWLWQGATDKDGYGFPWWRGRRAKAHRLAYELTHGPIPRAQCVCHTCDVPACVNPAHLWLGTNRQNQDDCTRKGRRPYGTKNGSITCPESRPRGASHSAARLTAEDVRAIRAATESAGVLTRQYPVSKTQICRIRSGKSWRI